MRDTRRFSLVTWGGGVWGKGGVGCCLPVGSATDIEACVCVYVSKVKQCERSKVIKQQVCVARQQMSMGFCLVDGMCP